MQELSACPGCGGIRLRPYSLTVESERNRAIHFSQSRCRDCDLVFSNPVATAKELEEYYTSRYYEEIDDVFNAKRLDLEKSVRARARQEVEGLRRMVLPYVRRGRFFEVGAGFGSTLLAAQQLGFSVAGVEPSVNAAQFAHERLGLTQVKCGIFCPEDWPDAFCDVAYSYHVIEHLRDPLSFAASIYRMLAPGGLAIIGTENHHNSWVAYQTVASWLKGRTLPGFQTSDHHTFYFCNHSLRRLLETVGFRILRLWVYTHTIEEKLRTARFRSIHTKAFFYLLHYSDVWTKRGNRLVIWYQKPRSR